MSKGFCAAEEGHVVLLLAPRGTTTTIALTSDTINMENWAHATILVAGGIGSGTTAITVGECVGFGGTSRTAIAFRYAKEDETGGDVLDAALAWGTTASLGGTAGVFIVIEIDADELSDGYNFLQVNFSANIAAEARDLCCFAILSGGRYQEDITATVIA